jgi:hypothetical protein
MATVKKSAVKKGAGRKTTGRKAAEHASGRKYGPAASANVERELKAMHAGKLTIGNSDKKVTNPRQAIAIALAETRRAGDKAPPSPDKAPTTPEKAAH